MQKEVSNIDKVGSRIVSDVNEGDDLRVTIEGDTVDGIVKQAVTRNTESFEKVIMLSRTKKKPIGIFVHYLETSEEETKHYNIDAYLMENTGQCMKWIGLVTGIEMKNS